MRARGVILKIAVITNNYPHPKFPQSGSFVKKLTEGISEQGVEVDVYALVSLTNLMFRRSGKETALEFNENTHVNYINYMSFSNFNIFGLSSADVGFWFAANRLRKAFNNRIATSSKPDVLYGKFLLSGVRHAARLASQYSIPLVADLGESSLLQRLSPREISRSKEIINELSGVICVSPRLVREVISLGMDKDKVIMLPNGIDANKFYPIDILVSRKQLNLPIDKKLVIFVGHFIHRKGPDRVLQALERLPEEYLGIFIGEGPIRLRSKRVLFQGRVKNEDLNLWLNAADVFCLPTLAEGSCNALEEARAVGLSIVTSNISDITDFDASKEYTLVSPENVDDIARGIIKASNNNRPGYIERPLSNAERSKHIISWLNKTI